MKETNSFWPNLPSKCGTRGPEGPGRQVPWLLPKSVDAPVLYTSLRKFKGCAPTSRSVPCEEEQRKGTLKTVDISQALCHVGLRKLAGAIGRNVGMNLGISLKKKPPVRWFKSGSFPVSFSTYRTSKKGKPQGILLWGCEFPCFYDTQVQQATPLK